MNNTLLTWSNRAYAAYQILQYATVYSESHHPEMTKDVHRITLFFMTTNAAFLLWNTVYPSNHLSKTKNWGILSLAGIGGGAYYYFYDPSTQAKEPVNVEDVQGTISVNWNPPQSQKLARAFYIAQIIQTLGGVFFGEYRAESLIQLAGSLGVLFEASKMHWIEIGHKSPVSHTYYCEGPVFGLDSRTLENPTIFYHALLPHHNVNLDDEDSCPICLEDSPDSYYCSNKHVICKDCLIDHYIAKVKKLALQLLQANRVKAVFMYENDSLKEVTYKLHFSENELPQCPICREAASHAFLTFEQGKVVAHEEENAPKSSFWTSAYLLFSAVQLTMAAVQYTHPHLAGTLFSIQRMMLPLDALVIGGLVSSEAKMFQVSIENNKVLNKAFILTIILGGVLTLYHWGETSPSLISHLKEKVSQSQLDNITIDGTPPISLRVMQWVYGSRLFLTLAIASFSTNKKLLIAAAILNGATALKLSHLTWICFQRIYKNEVGLPGNVSSTTRFHFMIPNPQVIIPNEETLKEILFNIYNYSTTFFKKSTWSASYDQYRTLKIDVSVIPQPLKINGFDFFKLLQSWGGKATINSYGTGSLSIST